MTLHWYKPPTPSADNLAAYLEHLHPLGVRWCEWPEAPGVTYRLEGCKLLASIGALTYGNTSGLIRIYAHRGIGRRESQVLAGTAQLAFQEKPTKAAGWNVRPRNKHHEAGWIAYITVQVEDGGQLGELVAAHQRSMENETLQQLEAMMRGAGD